MRSSRSHKTSGVLKLVAVLGCILAVRYAPDLLRPTYRPSSAEIEQLATATTMTPAAQQLFYKQDPTLEPKQRFRELCQGSHKLAEKAILLGCYSRRNNTGKIVIQQVTDARLNGIVEVTAAHEMLHVAYEQLSDAQREALAPRLKAAAKRVTDPRLASVLDAYAKGDQALYVNELHSHLGTELADLGDPELERHYQQYFRDRQQVIALALQSQRTLAQLDAKANQLKPEIDALEASLKQEASEIKQVSRELQASSQTLDQAKTDLFNLKLLAEQALQRGDVSLVSQFDLAQAQFNAQVNEHNAQVQQNQARIAAFDQQLNRYKAKVNAYNALAKTERSILGALKLNPAGTAPAQLAP
jgi:hypothetical protein